VVNLNRFAWSISDGFYTEAANAKSGKQHGENIAVKKSPAVPNLSMLLVNFIVVFSVVFMLCCLSGRVAANVFGLGEGGDFHHKC
jgi:hypothetical protein